MLKHKTGRPQQDNMGRFGKKKSPVFNDSPLSPPTRDTDNSYRRAPSIDVYRIDEPERAKPRELPVDSGDRRADEIAKLRSSLSEAHKANAALKNSTSTLLEENLQLKECLETSDAISKPNPESDELAHLLHMMGRENERLREHFGAERANWLEIKALQSGELGKLSGEVAERDAEAEELRRLLASAQANWDTAATRIHVLEDELREVIPMERHREAMKRAETLLYDLRNAYKTELAGLTSSLKQSQEQVRVMSRRVAVAESECLESRRDADEREQDAADLRRRLDSTQLQLSAALSDKDAAEKELSRLMATLRRSKSKS